MEGVLKISSATTFCAVALCVLLAGASVKAAESAASPCKDLDETGCKADTTCSWVKASKAKKAFCRAKPAKKSKAAKTPPAAAQ
jgi:hypothetical protein